MYDILQDEFSLFKHDIDEGALVFGRYFSEDDYIDEYSRNEISKFQGMLLNKIKAYLHQNVPGKYIVIPDWCIFVMTIDEAKRRNISKLSLLLID